MKGLKSYYIFGGVKKRASVGTVHSLAWISMPLCENGCGHNSTVARIP